MTLDKVKKQTVDPEVVIDYLEKQREFVLTVRASDLEHVKSRLSQSKFKRDIQERMSMRALSTYRIPADPGSGTQVIEVVDLHIKLGTGTEIFVVKCQPVDNEL